MRALVSLLLLAPVLWLTSWFILEQINWIDFREGGGSVMILFVVMFPPGWFALMIVYFAQPERLAGWQHGATVTGAVLLSWFLLGIWMPGVVVMTIGGAFELNLMDYYDPYIRRLGLTVFWAGQFLAWLTVYYALRSLPPPLGHRVKLY